MFRQQQMNRRPDWIADSDAQRFSPQLEGLLGMIFGLKSRLGALHPPSFS
jgi:hypothetical protein